MKKAFILAIVCFISVITQEIIPFDDSSDEDTLQSEFSNYNQEAPKLES